MFKKKSSLLFVSLCLCFCSCDGKSNRNKIDYKYFENDTYVVGKRVYDCYHKNDEEPLTGYLSVKELPHVDLTYYSNGCFKIEVNGSTIETQAYSVYVADINQDGNFDICYCATNDNNNDFIYAYDVSNDKKIDIFILEGLDGSKNHFYLDLDENNVLCIVETRRNFKACSLASVCRTARILKQSSNSRLEWFELKGYKLLGFDAYTYSKYSYDENTLYLNGKIRIYCFLGTDCYDTEFLVTEKDFTIEKVSGPETSNKDFKWTISYDGYYDGTYNIEFFLPSKGEYVVKISLKGLSSELTLSF